MRRILCAPVLFGTVLAASLATAAFADDPIPQTEQVDVRALPPADPHRVLVTDGVFNHAKDGRVYVVDSDHGRILGMMQAEYNANIVADPAGKSYYVGETIWTRGNRGERQDLLAAYDSHTLMLTRDITLPGRALITTKKQDMDISADGHLVYVFNFTPSNSVIVVDTQAGKAVGSVDVPGCALAFAWGNAGFTSICADGSLANVDVTDPAKPAVTHTKPFFSPEKDAVFEQSPTVRDGGHTLFISYSGLVYPATLGASTTVEAPWSIQQAAGMPKAPDASQPFAFAWRPGGWQLAALHHSDGHLFVLMHQGTFWTHKQEGSEIWELDANRHRLIRRLALPEPSNMIGVTQDASPVLFVADDEGDFMTLDAESGKVLHRINKLGDNLLFTMAPGE